MLEDNIIFQIFAYLLVIAFIMGLIAFMVKFVRIMLFDKEDS